MPNPRSVVSPRTRHYLTSRQCSLFELQVAFSPCTCRNQRRISLRHFSSSQRAYGPEFRESFGTRLRRALNETRIKWYPIPVGLGVGFLGLVQWYRINEREKNKEEEDEDEDDGFVNYAGTDSEGRPKKRQRIRPTGPWQVQVMSTLPLKGMSRIWGWFNELTIPYYLRVPGFKLYGWIFGVKYVNPINMVSI